MAKRRKGRFREMKFSCPEDVALKMEMKFYDPALKRVDYGARSTLLTALIERWLNEPHEEIPHEPELPSTGTTG